MPGKPDPDDMGDELQRLYDESAGEKLEPLAEETGTQDPTLMELCGQFVDHVGEDAAHSKEGPGIDVILQPSELSILEEALRLERKDGKIPQTPQERVQPFMMLAKNREKFPYLAAIAEKIPSLRDRGKPYFFVPAGFADSSFQGFEMLCEGHQQAWNLLTHFGLKPETGLYLYGNIGSGKTHLACAFANLLQSRLQEGCDERISKLARLTIEAYEQNRSEKPSRTTGDAAERTARGIVMYYTKKLLTDFPYQPSELAFCVFDSLFDRRADTSYVDEIIRKRIVIIDDIHHKGERDRMAFIQKIVESRYNEVRSGATFMTSNISPEHLLVTPEYPEEVARRAKSRLEEMSFPIFFGPERDYRSIIAERRRQRLLEIASGKTAI